MLEVSGRGWYKKQRSKRDKDIEGKGSTLPLFKERLFMLFISVVVVLHIHHVQNKGDSPDTFPPHINLGNFVGSPSSRGPLAPSKHPLLDHAFAKAQVRMTLESACQDLEDGLEGHAQRSSVSGLINKLEKKLIVNQE